MTKIHFRILIMLRVAFVAAGIAVAFVPDMYSPALAFAYSNEPEPWIITSQWLSLATLVPLTLLTILAIVGLFFFKHWGRALSLYGTIAITLLSASFGPSVESAIESALLDVSILLWGAILALAYYSPVSSMFGNNPHNWR